MIFYSFISVKQGDFVVTLLCFFSVIIIAMLVCFDLICMKHDRYVGDVESLLLSFLSLL